MKNAVCLTVCLSLLFPLMTDAEVRTWSTPDGKFKTEAEFIELSKNGKTVTLKRKDSKEISVSLEKLSKNDQNYVEKQTKSVATNKSKDIFRKKIDLINYESDGSLIVELSEDEKESVGQYLLLAETALKRPYSADGLSLLLRQLASYKGTIKNNKVLFGKEEFEDITLANRFDIPKIKGNRIDAYVTCLAALRKAYAATAHGPQASFKTLENEETIIESLLPTSNRLSGNAHDEEEKMRLENKRRKAEAKSLFGK